jgi:hypothetical protein
VCDVRQPNNIRVWWKRAAPRKTRIAKSGKSFFACTSRKLLDHFQVIGVKGGAVWLTHLLRFLGLEILLPAAKEDGKAPHALPLDSAEDVPD